MSKKQPMVPIDRSDSKNAMRRKARERIVIDRLVPGMIAVINQIGPKQWFKGLSGTQQYNLIMRAMELDSDHRSGVTAAGQPPQILAQMGNFTATLVESEKKQMREFETVEPPVVGSPGYNPAKAVEHLTGDAEVAAGAEPTAEEEAQMKADLAGAEKATDDILRRAEQDEFIRRATTDRGSDGG